MSGAEALLSKSPLTTENKAEVNFLWGLLLVRQNRPEEAVERFRTVLNTTADHPLAFEWLANLLREQGELKEAAFLASHLINKWPELATGYVTLGLCLREQGRRIESEQVFSEMLRKFPNSVEAHFNYGQCLEENGDHLGAISAYERVLELDSKLIPGYLRLAALLMKRNRVSKAKEVLRNATNHPCSVEDCVNLSALLTECQMHEEAAKLLQNCIQRFPDSAPSHYALGLVYEVLGKFEPAIESFRCAALLNSKWVAPLYELTKIQSPSSIDSFVAEQLLLMIEAGSLGDADLRRAHYGLGKIYDGLREFERAMHHYDEANRLSLQIQLAGKPWDVTWFRSWHKQLIKRFDEKYINERATWASESAAPIFIIGMIRSGTTLVEQVLSSHGEVVGGGELPFWTAPEQLTLQERMVEGRLDQAEASFAVARYLRQVDSIRGTRGRMTDKMPLNFNSLGLIHKALPNAKIIHCKRTQVDVALSIYQTPFDSGAHFCYSKRSIVDAILAYEQLMNHWRSVIPSTTFYEVSYEDLVNDPEAQSRQLVEFLGLEWDDNCLSHVSNRRTVQTPSRWQVRQPMYTSSIAKWKNYEAWLGEFVELV